MGITRLTSREFNQHTSEAKKAAERGPVFITDRGQPAHALLSMKDYLKLTGKQPSLVELLAMPGSASIEFEPPRMRGKLRAPIDLR